jgi:hypothetical protein
MFFISKFSYLLSNNPTHKTETGTEANKWETTNSEPAGPIIMIHQSEKLMNSQITFITLFCARMTSQITFITLFCARAQRRWCASCTATANFAVTLSQKQLFLSQTSMF